MVTQSRVVAAVIAAAGFSRRMGRFKPLLPWRNGTVIEAVAAGLIAGGASPVQVVTGHRGAEIAQCLAGGPARVVVNPDYGRNEMLRSYQVGIGALREACLPMQGALLALGDQPHIPAEVIRKIVERARSEPDAVVIPSHNRRRGHPVYIPEWSFAELMGLAPGQTLRDMLSGYNDEIVYVEVDSDCVRKDMDVPAEYESLREEYEQVS